MKKLWVWCDSLGPIYLIFGQVANFQWFSQFFFMAIIKIWGNDKIHKIMLYCPSYNGVKNVIVVTQTNAF